MSEAITQLIVNSTAQTAALAQRVGLQLRQGDTILLQGDIGAGKSFFARSLIQSLQDIPEDVPSPTFTLVQTYETRAGEIWHADLYRLSDPDEAEELGLTDAFTTAICLIEWPDRLASLTPINALTLSIETTDVDDQRNITFAGGSVDLKNRLSKALV
ncbi:MAG: tRNA (adenosine(37)-N6)-threonylcarbamoyltransferase complex ATPase subunit type 1 TsaE [Planktotalea sp.]|uniref:tRNA (adenosine(37)-N6)-threonylcarbamoyltransferase complex ATPase subunit type 1 TsaE n=1 Tax=Planktotalea sp. TaxID=2029877 RepID=UPI003C719A95